MKEMKKILSFFLCFVMLLGFIPATAFAVRAEETGNTETQEDAALTAALDEAKAYIDGITISHSENDPATVVSTWQKQFSWDNEKRESNNKGNLYDWSYYNGVVFEGLEYLYEITGDSDYEDYVVEYMSSLIASDGTWAKTTNNSSKTAAGYDASHGADSFKTASLLLDAYEMTGDSRYLTMAETVYADLDSAANSYSLSNAGNNYRHTWASDPSPDLWLDGLYMILPFRAEYAKYIGDTEELDLIVSRLQWVSDNMYDEDKGLFYHAADNANSNSGTYWLRSMGWYAAAMVDVMDSMDGENLETMKAQLVKFVEGMKACQNASNGMWLNNMNASQSSTNPYETSGTSLVCYAVMKAVNNGWLDESYADMAILAFKGICNEKLENNNLTDICFKGAPGSSNSTFYDNEGKGVGPFIMFYAEVLEYVNPLTGIAVSAPAKTEYELGEELDLTGMAVLGYHLDGSVEVLEWNQENCEASADMSLLGAQKVAVTYTHGTETFTGAFRSNVHYVDSSTSVDVAPQVPGVTNVTVVENTTDEAVVEALAEKVASFVTYDITLEGYNQGDVVTLTLPVPEGFDPARLIGVSIQDGEVKLIPGTYNAGDNTFTFNVDHFSTQGLAEVIAETSGTGNLVGGKVYTLNEDGVIDTTKTYLIVNTGSDTTDGHALTNNNGSAGDTSVTISDGKITVEDDTYIAWKFSGTENGTVGNNGHYVNPTYGSLSLNTSGTSLTISDQNNGAYRIYRYSSGSYGQNYYYYLAYSSSYYGSGWTGARAQNQYSVGSVYLYEYTSSSAGEAVTFTVTPGSATLQPGDTATLTGTVTVAGEEVDLSDCTINWASADEDVVTVSNGTVTGVADGTANITATLSAVNGTALQGNGIVLTVPVTVSSRTVSTVVMNQTSGSVERGSDPRTTETGSTITVTYDDGETETIDVTLDMVKGDYDVNSDATYTGLSVVYGGVEAEGDYTLTVTPAPGNNYPEYPKEGSVTVDKSADATYLQSTGVVKVELTTSGIPVKTGVDVVLTIDVSNSMCWETDTGSKTYVSNNKLVEVMTAVKNFADIFLADNEDGSATTNTITIVTFAGWDYENGSSTGRQNVDSIDSVRTLVTSTSSTEVVYAIANGTRFTAADTIQFAYIPEGEDPNDVANVETTAADGNRGDTNYDYGFWQTAQAITAGNLGEGGREVHVLFMTDGCASNFNDYYYRSSNANYYNRPGTSTAYTYYAAGTGTNWTNYILNTLIPEYNGNKYANDVYELVDGMYAVGFDMKYGSFSGLGNDWGSDTDWEDVFNEIVSKSVTDEYGNGLVPVTAASDSAALNEFYTSLANEIREAATSAYFVDQMGDSVSLQMTSTVNKRNESGTVVPTKLSDLDGQIVPQIQVLNYNIYKASDVNGTTVTEAMVGERYGDPSVVETVTFTDDGQGNVTGAYTTVGGYTLPDGTTVVANTTNILVDGVIYAKNFWYNTNTAAKTITLADGSAYSLPAETFRWNIGTINDVQWAMTYYVYLEGSMEGDAAAGSYKTNNYATLYYKNWLGNNAQLDTTAPQVGWKSANVSYAFYLVDANGNPIVNQTTGQTGSFYNAVKITQPVVYQEIMLNNLDEIDTIEASSVSILPPGYELYDETASYKVVILSEDGKGSWTITYDTSKVQSSYVTGYSGNYATDEPLVTSDKTVSGSNYTEQTGYDYTHTTVWFAVVWVPKAIPDTVVIDYGLPVDIGVLVNDQFGENGTLKGIGLANPLAESEALYQAASANFGTSLDGLLYGSAAINGTEVRYTPDTTPGTVAMNSYDRFYYEVEYDVKEYDANGNVTEDLDNQFYYGQVTVIPATTIYYEDSFLTLDSYTNGVMDTNTKWTQMGTTVDATQAEDRPGEYSLPTIDANNIYGYDQAYDSMSTYSMGSAAKITVDANTRGEAIFTFYGTGFDVIGLTSNATGTLTVQVYEGAAASGSAVKTTLVDTYYGMEEDGTISVNNPDALYQVPVIKIYDLEYKMYTVKITAGYNAIFDQVDGSTSYDLYLDAIRIYDPTGKENAVANEAYVADGEGWPQYTELRNNIISAEGVTSTTDDDGNVTVTFPTEDTLVQGAIFIDCNDAVNSIKDYVSYGPNNELYLESGQAVAFNINFNGLDSIVADVQIGLKVANGGSASYQIHNADTSGNTNVITGTLNTTTDMYYSILTQAKGGTIVITNNTTSPGILSITNIKITYKQNPNGTAASSIEIDEESATNAVNSLSDVEMVQPSFAPDKMDISFNRTTAEVGNNVVVTVTTSNDVENLLVNGYIAANKVTSQVTGETTWTFTVPVEENSNLDVTIVGYDVYGQFSVPYTETVTVVNMSGTAEDLLGQIFG